MKTSGAIKHKLNQVRFRHMKKRIESELRQSPGNCLYNAVVPPPPGVKGAQGVSLCLYGAGEPTTWEPTFCDERVDGGERAKGCSTFCAIRTLDEVKEDFRQDLEKMTFPEVAAVFPDMAALIWVLGEEDVPVAPEVRVEAPPTVETPLISSVETPLMPSEPVSESTSLENEDFVPEKQNRPWWSRWFGAST